MTDVGGNSLPDPFDAEVAGLADNDWRYRLNAAGIPRLASCFNYSGEPLGFPQLGSDERLVFDYFYDTDDEASVPGSVVIGNLDEMTRWYTAGRLNMVGVGGWRIEVIPSDSVSNSSSLLC